MKKRAKAPNLDAISEFRGLLRSREKELPSLRPVNQLIPWKLRQPVLPLTPRIETHAVYEWLQLSEHFQRAGEIFQAQRNRNDEPVRVALEELQFLGIVIDGLMFAAVTPPGWTPRRVSVDQRKATRKLATELKGELDGHATYGGFSGVAELRHLLLSLCDELKRPHRRDYGGPHARVREILQTIASPMFYLDGLLHADVVEIVKNCAALYGFDVSERSVQRYVDRAKDDLTETEKRAVGLERAKLIEKTRKNRASKRRVTRATTRKS